MTGKKNDVAALAQELALPIVAALGAELVDIEWEKDAGEWVLRLYIDRADVPVDHALCEAVSRAFSDQLDQADPIEQNYFLEVSSPGIERPLKKAADYQRFAGSQVAVKLFAPIGGKKEYQGTLLGLEDDMVQLEIGGKAQAFPLAQIAKTHLVVEF